MTTEVIIAGGTELNNGTVGDGYQGDHENGYDSNEEDVFMEDLIFDGRSLTKPLMSPRQRGGARVRSRTPECRCKRNIRPLMFILSFILIIGTAIAFIVYYRNQSRLAHPESDYVELVGCTEVEWEDVWVKGFPKLITESSARMVDLNHDGVLDVIMGFGTGVDGHFVPDVVCDIYFNGSKPCFGGILALEGLTGTELWRHYTEHEIFALTCPADFNNDGIVDCLGGGRGGTLHAVSGLDGKMIWEFSKQEAKHEMMNVYSSQVVRDLDGDGVVDIVATHGGDPLSAPGSKERLPGRILLMSGRTGKVLRWLRSPDHREVYSSPQVYLSRDATEIVLFGTGGETHPGSLWAITLRDLYEGHINKAKRVYWDRFKGIMTAPVLVDLNRDGVEDIVMSMFNESVIAIDGQTYEHIWNHTFTSSESYSTPAIGYFNNDTVPDFMVKFSYGPGFPLYYHAITTVLDGRTGKPLFTPVIDAIGSQSSPLTVNMEGYGNDMFLYWTADCKGHTGENTEYKFLKGTNVHEQSRSDFCRLRFKTQGYSQVYAISSNMKNKGVPIYYSVDREYVEHKDWINSTEEALKFVHDHPDHLQEYLMYSTRAQITENQHENGQPLTSDQADDKYNSEEPPAYDNPDDDTDSLYQNILSADNSRTRPDYDYNTGNPWYEDVPNGYNNDYENYRNRNQGRGYNSGQYSPYRGREHFEEPDTSRRKPLPLRPRPAKMKHFMKRRQKRSMAGYDDIHLPEFQFAQKEDPSSGSIFNKEHVNALMVKLREAAISRINSRKPSDTSNSDSPSRHFMHKRHVGPHDEGGLQRLISTGTLAPSTLDPSHSDYNHSIDYVFATYWFFPAKTEAILPEDQKCIKDKMDAEATIRFDPKSVYYGLDHDLFEHTVEHECTSRHATDADGQVFESQSTYNPYNVHMGQMTIYRLRLKCKCKKSMVETNNRRCARILPFEKQQWSGYMGTKGDSHWRPNDPE